MKQNKTILCLTLCSIALCVGISLADFPTPFVEVNNQVGDVSQAHAFIVTLGPLASKTHEHYLVVVPTDFGEYVVIDAIAKKEIVKETLLGREIVLEAEVIERIEDSKTKHPKIKLKILSVVPIKAKNNK